MQKKKKFKLIKFLSFFFLYKEAVVYVEYYIGL
jgi:hypothetical protein